MAARFYGRSSAATRNARRGSGFGWLAVRFRFWRRENNAACRCRARPGVCSLMDHWLSGGLIYDDAKDKSARAARAGTLECRRGREQCLAVSLVFQSPLLAPASLRQRLLPLR
ncbi:hypothetical protein MTO96_012653 [Rhipicephalus appendiculatus]